MLAQFSDALAALAEATTPLVVAVRTGQNRHVTGLRWRNNLVLVAEQNLPAADTFTLVLPRGGGLVAGEALQRNPRTGLAGIGLNAKEPIEPPREAKNVATGRLAMLSAAAFDASAAVRLVAIHRVGPAPGNQRGTVITLDIPSARLDPGSIVFDMDGGIVGLATTNIAGDVVALPFEMLREFADPPALAERAPNQATDDRPASNDGRRGWLGLSLQPTNLPAPLRELVGQSSGRMVIDITPDGPADKGGLEVGDVLVAVDGHSVNGPQAFRSVIASERIGHRLEVTLVRNGSVHVLPVVVAIQPGT